jgi:hypothetical protein
MRLDDLHDSILESIIINIEEGSTAHLSGSRSRPGDSSISLYRAGSHGVS